MKKHLLIISFILCLCLCLNTALASFTNEWGEYQDDASNRGFVHDEKAHFDEGIDIIYSSGINGMAFQPLIVNITGDSDLETIIYSGNYIQIYDAELNLINEKNMGYALQSQPTIYNNGNQSFIVLITSGDNKTKMLNYNGSFNELYSVQLNVSLAGQVTGIKYLNDYFYVLTRASQAGDKQRFYKLNTTLEIINNTVITGGNVRGVPAIGNLDANDANDEVIFLCDTDDDTNFGVCVFDSVTGTLDTSFSTDGILDDIGGVGKISNPVLWNLDGAGATELIISHKSTATNRLAITALKSNGDVLFEADPQAYNAVEVMQTVVVDYGGNGKCDNLDFYEGGLCEDESSYHDCIGVENIFGQRLCEWNPYRPGLCTSATSDSGGGVWQRNSICVDYEGTEISHFQSSFAEAAPYGVPIIGADMNSDGFDELVFPDGIYYVNGTLMTNLTSSAHLNYYNSVADLNNDGELEVISTKAGASRIYYSAFINSPPTINNSYNYGGYGSDYGFGSPICLDTLITFSANECGGSSTCNYVNDGSEDDERLASNCGQLASGIAATDYITNLDYGNYVNNSIPDPLFQCFYNVTGRFNVRIYLQDEFNEDSYSQYNSQTISVFVMDGVAGVTCNLEGAVEPGSPDEVDDVPSSETATNDAIDDSFGLLFGTGASSDKLKLIVGLAIVIAIIIWAAQQGVHSGQALLGIGIITTLMVTFIGLLTPAIIILVIAALLLIIILGKAIGSGSDAGGV